jgi:hypothetical protein
VKVVVAAVAAATENSTPVATIKTCLVVIPEFLQLGY